MWHVYIVQCKDGSKYTGITTNLERRMRQHKKGQGSKYVNSRGYQELLEHITVETKSEALKIEYAVKQQPAANKIKFLNNKE